MLQQIESVLPSLHYQADDSLAAFVAELPKTETHLHLEGSMSFGQLQELDPHKYAQPPPFWQPSFRYAGFEQFQAEFDRWVLPYHNSIDRYQRTARFVFERCKAQGCLYVESSFHLPAVAMLDGDGPELLAAIHEVVPAGLEVRLFGGMTHTDYQTSGALLESALDWQQLAGIDLHGPEYWPVDSAFPNYWRRARECGKLTKAHAGEFMPASFVGWVVDELAVQRVQHGVRAIESAAVVERLIDLDIGLDVCPISNLKLGVEGIDSMAKHPMRALMEAGVCVTVSTDDTFMFGNSLVEEYYALVQELGFSRTELIGLARNGFNNALLDDEQRRTCIARLDRFAANLEATA